MSEATTSPSASPALPPHLQEKSVARPDRLALGAFMLAVLIGGTNPVAVRFAVAELPPFQAAAIRFGGAALIFWAFVAVRRVELPRGRALAGVLLYGALNFGVAYAFVFWGLKYVPAGPGQVVLSLAPLFTFLFAVAHRMERFRWQAIVGALITIVGIAVVFLRGVTGIPLAPVLALAAGVACFSESLVLINLFSRTNPISTNAVAMSFGVLLLVALSLAMGEAWTLPTLPITWAGVAFMILVGSVALFSLSIFIVRRWSSSATSYALVLMPFVTVWVAALLAGEPVTVPLIVGILIAVFGVWVGTMARFGDRRTV